MNGLLGRNYKFTYGARNYVSGLSITATVLKPDGSLLGNYSLTEFSYSTMKGVYYFEMVTTDSMPEGEYTVVINEFNPLLEDYKAHSKVTMRLGYGNIQEETDEKIVGVIYSSSLVGELAVEGRISGVITDNSVIGTIPVDDRIAGIVLTQSIIGKIESNVLMGVIVCLKS